MAIIKDIPKDSRFIQSVNTFVATFNAPTLGAYDWNVAANTGQVVIDLRKQSVFLLEKLSFSATVAEGDFLEAVTTVPTIRLRRRLDQQNVFYKPIPIVSYVDGNDAIQYVWTRTQDNNPDDLIIDFRGVLTQTAALVGIVTITAQVTFNFYEIVNSAWLKQFRAAYGKGQVQREFII